MQAVGIILAAGLSSRMGQLKALLPLGAETVLGHQIRVLRQGGAERVIVVTGHERQTLEPEIIKAGGEAVFNPQYQQGMFSSVLTGLRAAGECDCILLLPVDCPLVEALLVASLLEEFRRTRPPVLYPAYQGKKGHPPVIGRSCFSGIFAHDGTMGLRGALEQWKDQWKLMETDTVGVAMDMDTPEDYQRILKFICPQDTEPRKP